MPPGYFPAGTGLGCGFLPFDSFFLSLLPMMISLVIDRCNLPQAIRPLHLSARSMFVQNYCDADPVNLISV